jgi:glycosyltransferase involved in cell wall biosynthesis
VPAGTLRLHFAGGERTDTAYGRRVIRRMRDLPDRVVRHGPCDDAEVGHLYRSADLFVSLSHWETYGTAMGTAAACRARSLPTWEQSAQQFFTILAGLP